MDQQVEMMKGIPRCPSCRDKRSFCFECNQPVKISNLSFADKLSQTLFIKKARDSVDTILKSCMTELFCVTFHDELKIRASYASEISGIQGYQEAFAQCQCNRNFNAENVAALEISGRHSKWLFLIIVLENLSRY